MLTFAQSPTALHTLQLVYGVVSWVTRGLFVGEHHVYASPQIDDFFLASQLYPTQAGTYRITADELQAFTNWQSARQADPLTAQFRAAFAFNAFGAKPAGPDGLTDKALALGAVVRLDQPHLGSPVMDRDGLRRSDRRLSRTTNTPWGSGLSPFSVENLVTPEISGLDNAEAMRAGLRRRRSGNW